MAERVVKWTRTADIQYIGILQYWVNRNNSNLYSKKLIKIVAELTQQIAKTPYAFRLTDFKDTRTAPLGNFNVFYKVHDHEIIITAFWDNRQNPKKLLKILKRNS